MQGETSVLFVYVNCGRVTRLYEDVHRCMFKKGIRVIAVCLSGRQDVQAGYDVWNMYVILMGARSNISLRESEGVISSQLAIIGLSITSRSVRLMVCIINECVFKMFIYIYIYMLYS